MFRKLLSSSSSSYYCYLIPLIALWEIGILFALAADEFKCPISIGSGEFADPQTCRRFYQCVDGHPYLTNCPHGLFFDDISKICTFQIEARCGPIASTLSPELETNAEDLAKRCNRKNCRLPNCFCSRNGTRIPGNLAPKDTPQIILMTFDGAVNFNNFDSYMKIFSKKFKNPNGCDIHGTFFVSHEYTNYYMVEKIANDGHEIAVGTISSAKGLENKNYTHWVKEFVGMRNILSTFANISKEDIIGARAPFLKPGRNRAYEALFAHQFIYDSSIGAPASDLPFWPYTLDYKIAHTCKTSICPSKSFPGLWEVPLNTHYVDGDDGGRCPYLDQCVLHDHDSSQIAEWLKSDFLRHYTNNKAPYMMAFHTNWFFVKSLKDGLAEFMEWAVNKDDVWFLTIKQMLEWITSPSPIKNLKKSTIWECNNRPKKVACDLPNNCALSHFLDEGNFSEIRYLETCKLCPDLYPWLGNPRGINSKAIVNNHTASPNKTSEPDEDDDDNDYDYE